MSTFFGHSEVRTYERKQESKKIRNQTRSRPRNQPRKGFFFVSCSRACFGFFFLIAFFVEIRFLDPNRVFLFSYFLVFFYKFPPLYVSACLSTIYLYVYLLIYLPNVNLSIYVSFYCLHINM